MALFLSRANRRPLTSPYRIHRLISQSSPLSTVSPGNDNTSSTAAADSQRQGVSSEDIHNAKIGLQSIWEELESLRTSNTNNAKGGSTSPCCFKVSKVTANSVRSLFGKIEGGIGSDFERRYSSKELGNLLKELGPELSEKGLFSLQERMNKLKVLEEERNSKSPFSDLRKSIQELSVSPSEKRPGPRFKPFMSGQSTPDHTLHPPKDELVEKHSHPDNMSSLEKMEVELAKIWDEFKMNESDCRSARVQASYPAKQVRQALPQNSCSRQTRYVRREIKLSDRCRIVGLKGNSVVFYMEDEPPKSEGWRKVSWGETKVRPEVVENFLLDTMIEEMKKGHLVSSIFSETDWSKIKNALEDKFNKEYTEKQLYNKYVVLRRKYSNFKKLLSHTGMSYNASTGQVTAEEEVWALASKVGGKAVKKFREKGCPEYPKLCSLFGDTSDIGVSAKTSMRTLSDDDHEGKVNDEQQNEVKDEISGDFDDVKEVSKAVEGKMKCKVVVAPTRKKSNTAESLRRHRIFSKLP